MAKQPQAGNTKTRLYPLLNPQQAAELYEALLLDTIDLAARLDGIQLAVAATPPEARDYFERHTPAGTLILPVKGADIGECLMKTIGSLLSMGYRKALALNADGPSLPPEYIRSAVTLLDDHEIVLGPGHDGGYYLVGMKTPHPQIFAGIQWSTSQVLDQTLDKISELGVSVALTPEWYDVDTPDDLQRIKADLQVIPAGRLEHVRRFLTGLS
jgi:rSAM/selenodomain-associated transferase 1